MFSEINIFSFIHFFISSSVQRLICNSLFVFRFSVPQQLTVANVGDVNELRQALDLTGGVVFNQFLILAKSFLHAFPLACILYLGMSRTWYAGPKVQNSSRSRSHYPQFRVSFQTRRFRSHGHWSGQISTEERKRKCLVSKRQVVVLPVYRSLRNKFLQSFKKHFIVSFPLERHILAPKKIFFNNVFNSLRESHIHDQYGHLSDSGISFIIERIENIFQF